MACRAALKVGLTSWLEFRILINCYFALDASYHDMVDTTFDVASSEHPFFVQNFKIVGIISTF